MTEAKKRADAKWQAAHQTTLGCRVRKEEAAAFRAACAAQGTCPNAVLLATVREYLKQHPAPMDAPQNGTQAELPPDDIPDTLIFD